MKTVSAVLGHSQTSTTLNIYAHAIAEVNAKAVDVVEDIYTTSARKHERKEKGRFKTRNRPIMNTKKAVMNTVTHKEPPHKNSKPANAHSRRLRVTKNWKG